MAQLKKPIGFDLKDTYWSFMFKFKLSAKQLYEINLVRMRNKKV
jgi:hypothetical protein